MARRDLRRVRNVITHVFGLLAVGVIVVMSGCETAPGVYGSNCPIDASGHVTVPRECCPCPTPEECYEFYYDKGLSPPPIPAWCCEQGFPTDPRECAPPEDGGVNAVTACTEGRCIPKAPEGWIGPELVYVGSFAGNEVCPAPTPEISFEGSSLPPAMTCAVCSCAEPEGTCELPQTWTASSAACNLGGIETPFNPPPGWDGSCTTEGAIPANKDCSGQPCVQSLYVSAPIIEEGPCGVLEDGMPRPPPPKAKADVPPLVSFVPPDVPGARACAPSDPWQTCEKELDKACLPPPQKNFAPCVRTSGDKVCPAGWPVHHLVYNHMDDKRRCSECTCSEPSGGKCIAQIYATSGGACSGMPLDGVGVSTDKPVACFDVMPPGSALIGKKAELISYVPGTCQSSGGEPIYDVTVADPTTFCCLKETASSE
jgi:hypothetical protein